MKKYILLVFTILNTLHAAQWSQFHGNPANIGFMPVQTSPAVEPAWSYDVGPINGTCPSIGPDGTIYVGNRNGLLTALNPDGSLKWKRELRRGWECNTPAIADDGTIYVGCTLRAWVRDHRNSDKDLARQYVQRSYLFCCNPVDGSVRWIYKPPVVQLPNNVQRDFFFTSPPKVCDNHILLVEAYWAEFLMQRNYLIVLDQNGQLVNARFLSEAAFAEVTGGGFKPRADIGSKPLPAGSKQPENAIAIADFMEPPLVVVIDDANAVTAFQWENNNISSQLWSRPPDNTTFAYFVTSPALFFNEACFFGRSDGKVFLMDGNTGQELYQPWVTFNRGIYSCAASFIRQIYLIDFEGKMIALDSDATVWKTIELGAQSMSSPAMSANLLYVNTADGIHTLTFDLEKEAHFEFTGGGNSSPVIGRNGAVYTLDSNRLYAFPG